MARPKPLSGFPEFLPDERIVEQTVLDTLRETFELHGFGNIETRAVEPLAQLSRKGEITKEVYVVRRLHADEADQDELGLHFDLTVPLARWVLEHSGALQFPFRRYQIQKVWRGERPQEGRYRESSPRPTSTSSVAASWPPTTMSRSPSSCSRPSNGSTSASACRRCSCTSTTASCPRASTAAWA